MHAFFINNNNNKKASLLINWQLCHSASCVKAAKYLSFLLSTYFSVYAVTVCSNSQIRLCPSNEYSGMFGFHFGLDFKIQSAPDQYGLIE